ncbi:MAG TPA: S41 family peptidase [Rhizomicrobium sp.]|nr:S41 family peptidase [Rhizomicrobium sp.]
MRNLLYLLAAGLLVCWQAQAKVDSASAHWRALTEIDVEAAHALLSDNHPAATHAINDPAFMAALANAYADARARARKVTNYPGYVATLGAFATAMGDGHIWSHPIYVPAFIQWAGIIAAKRGANWVVAYEDLDVVGEDVAGARIVSCDGVPVEALARDTLGRYLRVWSVEAMRVLGAPRLLVDEGNPFVTRPDACVIEMAGKQRTIELHWKNINRASFLTAIKGVSGKPGYGIRQVGPATWISIETFGVKAQAVIDAARAQQEQLRSAPYVVVDLRGNGGGDDDYGRKLAGILYGDAFAVSRIGQGGDDAACPPVWRASPENITAVEATGQQFAQTGETAGAKEYSEAVIAMRKALKAHQELTGSPTCTPPKDTLVASNPASLMRGRVFVITDSVCFSSCIDVAGFFKKLGATLVGQTTGADTHFSEVREITLPSGLSTFSTLQAVEPDLPRAVGPYVPDVPYDGDISDTAALETWIAGLAAQQR